MDIIKLLGIMADGTRAFFDSISFSDTLLIVAVFLAIVFALLISHVLFGVKAHTARSSKSVAKYFEGHYMGTYFDGKKFLRRKRFCMSRKARREFRAFLDSNTNIRNTDFLELLTARGRDSLTMVLPTFRIASFIGIAFILLKAYVDALSGLELILLSLVSVAVMGIMHVVLFFLLRHTGKMYARGTARLDRSLSTIRYNNEYANLPTDIRPIYRASSDIAIEKALGDMMDRESTLSGDSQVEVRDSLRCDDTSDTDTEKSKYIDILKKYGIGQE